MNEFFTIYTNKFEVFVDDSFFSFILLLLFVEKNYIQSEHYLHKSISLIFPLVFPFNCSISFDRSHITRFDSYNSIFFKNHLSVYSCYYSWSNVVAIFIHLFIHLFFAFLFSCFFICIVFKFILFRIAFIQMNE